MAKFAYANVAIVVLAIYLAIMLFIGWYASKRIKDQADFIVAGRRLPLWLSVGTLVATWFCGGMVMGSASYAYSWGLQGVVWDPYSSVVAFIIAGLFFVRIMRRARYLTPADMFQSRFGKPTGVVSAVVISLTCEITWVASVLVAFGAVIMTFTGIPLATGIIIAAVVVAVYTYMGGMWAVTLTDFVQMCLLILGIVIMFPMVINLVGGWSSFVANAGNVEGLPPFALWPVSAEQGGFSWYTGAEAWNYYIIAWLSIGFASIPAQDLWERLLAAKDEKTCFRTCVITAVIYLVIGTMCPLTGIAAWILNPNLTGEAIEAVIPWLATTYMAPAFAVFFCVALIAALMSSGDSGTLAAASLWGRNIQLAIRPKATDKQILRWTRVLVPVALAFSALIALAAARIYWLMCMAYAIALTVIFIPFVLGIFWKKFNQYGCLTYIIAAIIIETVLTIHYIPVYGWEDATYMVALPTMAICLVISVVVTLLTQNVDPPKPFVDIDGNPLPLKNWLGSWNAVEK